MRYQLAIIQHPPVMLNLQASLETAVQYIVLTSSMCK